MLTEAVTALSTCHCVVSVGLVCVNAINDFTYTTRCVIFSRNIENVAANTESIFGHQVSVISSIRWKLGRITDAIVHVGLMYCIA